MRFNSATVRLDLHAAAYEFVGTVFFLILAFGGIQAAAYSDRASQAAAATAAGEDAVNTVASIGQLLYISLSMGFSLLVSAWLFFRVTGGQFNPAVSLTLFLVGCLSPLRFVLYCIAQLAGAIAASAIILSLIPGPLVVGTAPGLGVNSAQACFIEMLLTAALCFAVLMLAVEKHRSTAIAPIGIGLTLFAGHLFGVPFTGAATNPARAFGPAVVTRFEHTHWIYWVGPLSGSLLATGLYTILKRIDYGRINPGQDTADEAQSPAASDLLIAPLTTAPTAVQVQSTEVTTNDTSTVVSRSTTIASIGAGNPVRLSDKSAV